LWLVGRCCGRSVGVVVGRSVLWSVGRCCGRSVEHGTIWAMFSLPLDCLFVSDLSLILTLFSASVRCFDHWFTTEGQGARKARVPADCG